MQKQKILVAGSLAYDHVMEYDGYFKDMLLPQKLDSLSVTFTSNSKKVHYGGTGGNIAYTLKLLGCDPLLVGVAGKDFDEYKKWLEDNGIDASSIVTNKEFYTASAYILTDKSLNQITMFQIGAMGSAPHAIQIKDYADRAITWAIIAPDDAARMVRLSQECSEHKIKYIFDPAQQIGSLSPAQLLTAIGGAELLIANDYEAELLAKKLGITREKLSTMTPCYIETHGDRGASVRDYDGNYFVHAVKASNIVDPTGCGDAFRAGVLAGMEMNYGLEKSCKIGALAATYNLENHGTQGHKFTWQEFKKRYEENFGEELI
ncbi:MAG: carbohydrate kinase family protein [Candidatus Gracilibacteria bacterium]|jgi:adenosine kinase